MTDTKGLWFDGHNDALLRLSKMAPADAAFNFEDESQGEFNLQGARRGGLVGGVFAIFCPSAETETPGYYANLPAQDALPLALEQVSIFQRLERAGQLAHCRDANSLRSAISGPKLAAILHLEGAEALGEEAELLEAFYAFGLRSLGLVWSRQNAFGTGVPMIPDSSPEIGPGLTSAGKSLVQRCDDMGVIIDVSHLNEKGFWDVAEISRNPLVATHSNAHALCPHARNLTDQQLLAIRNSNGVVGLTFAVDYLRADGQRVTDTPLSRVVEHFEYMLMQLGPDCLAIGSDFDGAYVPDLLNKVERVPDLIQSLRERGHSESVLRKTLR
ncbi:MAG: dipeptidase, partial [Paracoccaceae bacterium]